MEARIARSKKAKRDARAEREKAKGSTSSDLDDDKKTARAVLRLMFEAHPVTKLIVERTHGQHKGYSANDIIKQAELLTQLRSKKTVGEVYEVMKKELLSGKALQI